MAEFNTVHIVILENASRFFSGAPVKIRHIPVKFFMTIAKNLHNPTKVSYVDLSSECGPHQCKWAPCRRTTYGGRAYQHRSH